MNRNITDKEILEEVEKGSSKIDNKKLDLIVNDEEEIKRKSSRLDDNKFKKLLRQLKLAMSLIKDFKTKAYTDIPWRSITLIGAAIIYFVNPFDLVPDMLPLFGFADDAVLFASIFKSIQFDLEKYAEWKGLDTQEYF
ncbi:MAG TPA: DUF1232 domain-containing protein [Ignavibacteria bacterium]|nr:DUF1232 domain-containing protein [Ignavibacteria bacterium]HMR38916.1 DUF1232 domain-containing protein [Ignavibacteria bacterium]